jgi:hypothetical protein
MIHRWRLAATALVIPLVLASCAAAPGAEDPVAGAEDPVAIGNGAAVRPSPIAPAPTVPAPSRWCLRGLLPR